MHHVVIIVIVVIIAMLPLCNSIMSTIYTNPILSRIHVNTTCILNIPCILVATKHDLRERDQSVCSYVISPSHPLYPCIVAWMVIMCISVSMIIQYSTQSNYMPRAKPTFTGLNHNITKQCEFICVGLKNITMGCHNQCKFRLNLHQLQHLIAIFSGPT